MEKLTNSQIDAQITAEDLGFEEEVIEPEVDPAEWADHEAGDNNLEVLAQYDSPETDAFGRGCQRFALAAALVIVVIYGIIAHAGH